MKAPPNPVRPIRAYRLRRIINGLGPRYQLPSSGALRVLAAALTGMQSCNDPVQWDPDFEVRSFDEYGHEHLRLRTRKPVWLRLKSATGSPKRRQKSLGNLLPDIAAEFRKAMKPTNPNEPFGDRDGPVADFVAAVIPLIFPGQELSADAVGQRLARRQKKTRACR
jgi:hypothetical protein